MTMAASALFQRRREVAETVAQSSIALEQLVRETYPTDTLDTRLRMVWNHFLFGLQPKVYHHIL